MVGGANLMNQLSKTSSVIDLGEYKKRPKVRRCSVCHNWTSIYLISSSKNFPVCAVCVVYG